ncbi:MAG TPA: cytochrome b/b6 domain-containing protein [Burkholderiales bacterium]
MNFQSAPPQRYDCASIALHWATALLVLLAWGGAQLIDSFAKGPPRWIMLGVHMSLGLALALVLIARVFWRATGGTRLPRAQAGAAGVIASGTHLLLYALLALQLVLGLANAWVRGEHVFTWFVIPAFDPGNQALRHQVGELHELTATLILAVAGLHAAAALFHHYVLRDGVLARMWPGRT